MTKIDIFVTLKKKKVTKNQIYFVKYAWEIMRHSNAETHKHVNNAVRVLIKKAIVIVSMRKSVISVKKSDMMEKVASIWFLILLTHTKN